MAKENNDLSHRGFHIKPIKIDGIEMYGIVAISEMKGEYTDNPWAPAVGGIFKSIEEAKSWIDDHLDETPEP